jgi:hypothetical protein
MESIISVYCRPSTEPASAAIRREVLTELFSLAQPLYEADESRRQAQENLHRAAWALVQTPKSKYRIVKRERKRQRKALWKTSEQVRTLSDRRHLLEIRLQGVGASFARQELFRFLKSKRYELNPLNLANAVAGLPYMGWRQSMRRCTRVRCPIANSLNSQIFKAIRYLVKTAKAKTEKALRQRFQKGIPTLARRYQLAKEKLAEDWLYVERAIRQSCRAKPHPKALPFEIVNRYLKQTQSQSQVDRVLAQQVRLNLAKKPLRSRPSNQMT